MELIVVGAGPGDPELITLKAQKALARARVILYDNLINRDLLAYAPGDCEKIYVGKKPYGEYTPQEEIHRLILEKALPSGDTSDRAGGGPGPSLAAGRCVVRLKGGDPFIFGRGMEEIQFARAHGIPASYIPGITSMQAAGLEDIPLTHRDLAESVWIVTGTKKDGTLSHDLRLALASRATVVVYMGMKKLTEIAAVYVSEGRGDTAAAIIQHASLPSRKKALGLVRDLPLLAASAGLTHPAIIIIGAVAGLAQ
ncbi:uroporphyrinogen-III C-methyltransferase [Dinghuibacter silviterrae]|uniref:uroporphyrinogen-III C-methyltransferase n=1 Tax=Dinghuibacter silviterrae TaxID=1539049 RepID=A0A4V3GLV9_9BACT|nr:uroporphyrinogen-III C-methyltransferase [Dinghuibacter silviterrae]TDX01003.1 uroporphyrin-III C-methyltransferase [Dinghuibacter silviterrae]